MAVRSQLVHTAELSVSSVGSWALQPVAQAAARAAGRNFQYPRSDRGHCNETNDLAALAGTRSFSILGRIVGTATLAHYTGEKSQNELSVSSVGSWALQLSCCNCQVTPQRPFSILGRIVGTATKRRPRPSTWPSKLSVSSVGSWALQPGPRTKVSPGKLSFSILGRIVGTATRPDWTTREAREHLSVSSVGSWALQHHRPRVRFRG